MSKIKELQKSATVAWSATAQCSDLIAAGSAAGTIGLDFDTSSQLEIYSLNIKDASTNMTLVGKTNASNRFHKLVWGQASGSDRTHGILAGGMDNGAVSLWDPAKIIAGKEEETILGSAQKHQGAVQALDFNPYQQNLLASGAADSEILVWDLSNPSNPSVYTPGTKPQQSSDVSPYILASSAHSGVTFIWDLKAKRSIISFTDSTKSQVRAITWNPQEATQVLTASEDDASPILQLWDLRNIYTPIRKYAGHKLGVWGVSWCPFDTSLIVSCGKDNRTLCWHAETAEVLCEVEAGEDSKVWNVDVQWSARTPAVLSTSSVSGKVNIIALQDVGERNTVAVPNDLGIVAGPQSSAQPLLRHAPSWLRRPVGVAFGFGGKLASFSYNSTAKKSTLKIRNVVTENDLLTRSERLEEVVNTGSFEAFCDEKIASSSLEGEEKYTWKFLKVLFDKEGRHKILDYLGFDETQTAKEIQGITGTLPQPEDETEHTEKEQEQPEEKVASPAAEHKTEEPESAVSDVPSEGQDKDVSGLFGSADSSFSFAVQQEAPQEEEKKVTPRLITPVVPRVPISLSTSAAGPESAITKALLIGNFEAAVNLCLRLDRMADALVLAACGGEDLWARTQARYFASQKSPYTRVMASIVRNDLQELVQQADLADWKAALSILCTYAKSTELPKLATILGDRLDTEAHNIKAATLCYICAGSIDKTVNVWIRTTKEHKDPHQALQDLIEKVSIFRHAVSAPDTELDELLARKYCEYAEILASQGRLPTSLRYLNFLSEPKYSNTGGAVLLDRVFNSFRPTGVAPPPFPFRKQEVGIYTTTPIVPVQQQQQSQSSQPVAAPATNTPHVHPQQTQQQFGQPQGAGGFGYSSASAGALPPTAVGAGVPPGTRIFTPHLPQQNYAGAPPAGPPPTGFAPPPGPGFAPSHQHGPGHVHPVYPVHPPPGPSGATTPFPVTGAPPVTSHSHSHPPPPLTPPLSKPEQPISPPPLSNLSHAPPPVVTPPPVAAPAPVPVTSYAPPVGVTPPPMAANVAYAPPSGTVQPPLVSQVPPVVASVGGASAPSGPINASSNSSPEVRYVVDALNRSLAIPLQGPHKAKWDDLSKRLPAIITSLEKGDYKPESVQLLVSLCKALEVGDQPGASKFAVDLADSIPGKDLVAVKRFVEVAKLRN